MSLTVNDLSYTYNRGLPTEAAALKGISFEAEKGEILSIVGHTGSGKSTLAMHLNGLIIPQSGEVSVDGMSIKKNSADLRKIRQAVGLVFQYPEQQIFAETVREEISFGPSNWGLSGDVLEERIFAAMDLIGLDRSFAPANPFMLSGGEKRRVAIASVLASDPDYLVLDEPSAGLDFNGLCELTSLLRAMSKNGKCVIHITHDLELALDISDRILIISDGDVTAFGSPLEISEILSDICVKGLILPDILSLSFELKKKGRINKITSDPFELAEEIRASGTACR
ncbi:MAG TPA: energy-coupling factor ABC transporter ATP-binding protein [Synergistaceae bacterium]|jgi:energy-coupling factor transport system ATP-binding protein|uniref:ATP-binding cassette domain-containing protein n=1 Tax=Synergistaceae TaxID=649777 RepID=UPI000ECB04D4|nr:ATP-binding cassette domain-containing protein [Synergistaceae bacterium DZ-S4]HAH69161.1 energy-coupling factor ABC transporter ATP-binding protein [Synergistaceae bacterium]